jgi:hypothetical protein
MLNVEIAEIKKDVDIKFGSKNLLSFGTLNFEKDNFKETKE